jgi:hypothetical protein
MEDAPTREADSPTRRGPGPCVFLSILGGALVLGCLVLAEDRGVRLQKRASLHQEVNNPPTPLGIAGERVSLADARLGPGGGR